MTSVPKFVYKIGTSFGDVRSYGAGPLPLSALDKQDGFIHLSTKEQVPATVGRFFATSTEIELLKIETRVIAHKTKWEASSSHGIFPHVYGDLLGNDILERKSFTTNKPETWEVQLMAEAFIE